MQKGSKVAAFLKASKKADDASESELEDIIEGLNELLDAEVTNLEN